MTHKKRPFPSNPRKAFLCLPVFIFLCASTPVQNTKAPSPLRKMTLEQLENYRWKQDYLCHKAGLEEEACTEKSNALQEMQRRGYCKAEKPPNLKKMTMVQLEDYRWAQDENCTLCAGDKEDEKISACVNTAKADNEIRKRDSIWESEQEADGAPDIKTEKCLLNPNETNCAYQLT
ncbi:hypothetical protein FAI40_03980 [Acetobacteraceae bacterium]|nr:hypothetical protein FAI40_03980 [Acetobacteraceae bacterium]